MGETEKIEIVTKLDYFLRELATYQCLQQRRIEGEQLNSNDLEFIPKFRNSLLRQVGKFRPLITELTGKEKLMVPKQDGGEATYDIWFKALESPYDLLVNKALCSLTDITTVAIGKLEVEIRMGKRDVKTGELIDKSGISTSEPPKAFIAHGGKSGVLDKLCEFIIALGIAPLIVELMPTKGMSVDEKVKTYMGEADCGIVLATKGGIIDTKSQKQHPRLNVIDELERLRAAFTDKTILLVEKGVDLPSNLTGLTYEPFARQSMDRAFIAIARELVAYGILKAVKP